jgi:putative FmdB family regulatory protein
MPTYNFYCQNCNYEVEDYKPISFPKTSVCPICGENTLIKLVGKGGGLIFKGKGFYVNDSKREKVEQSIKEAEESDG